jgi:hypothetical protein
MHSFIHAGLVVVDESQFAPASPHLLLLPCWYVNCTRSPLPAVILSSDERLNAQCHLINLTGSCSTNNCPRTRSSTTAEEFKCGTHVLTKLTTYATCRLRRSSRETSQQQQCAKVAAHVVYCCILHAEQPAERPFYMTCTYMHSGVQPWQCIQSSLQPGDAMPQCHWMAASNGWRQLVLTSPRLQAAEAHHPPQPAAGTPLPSHPDQGQCCCCC